MLTDSLPVTCICWQSCHLLSVTGNRTVTCTVYVDRTVTCYLYMLIKLLPVLTKLLPVLTKLLPVICICWHKCYLLPVLCWQNSYMLPVSFWRCWPSTSSRPMGGAPTGIYEYLRRTPLKLGRKSSKTTKRSSKNSKTWVTLFPSQCECFCIFPFLKWCKI